MSPRAMGSFLVRVVEGAGLSTPYVVGPDVWHASKARVTAQAGFEPQPAGQLWPRDFAAHHLMMCTVSTRT